MSLFGRSELVADSVLSAKERKEVFDGLLNCCRWVELFHAWRADLPDEADSHSIGLGVAAQAEAIVKGNLDASRGEFARCRQRINVSLGAPSPRERG
jgi:hypothetical protein